MCLPETGYLPPRSLFVYVENTHTHLPKVVRDTGRTGCEMNSDASALSPPPPLHLYNDSLYKSTFLCDSFR